MRLLGRGAWKCVWSWGSGLCFPAVVVVVGVGVGGRGGRRGGGLRRRRRLRS